MEVYIYHLSARREEIKVNENTAVNESKIKIKFNKDNNNFNERTNSTFNQQQDAINKTLDSTLNNVIRTTHEATQRDSTIHNVMLSMRTNYSNHKNIAFGFIEAQKQVIGSFQSQVVQK